jgi:hypothetical protein
MRIAARVILMVETRFANCNPDAECEDGELSRKPTARFWLPRDSPDEWLQYPTLRKARLGPRASRPQ